MHRVLTPLALALAAIAPAAGMASFGTPVDVSASPTLNARTPQIAVGPDGQATIAWRLGGITADTDVIQAATRAAGATAFGAVGDLSLPAQAQDPRIAVGADGTTVVTWWRDNGSYNVIQAATRAPGAASFGAPVSLSASDNDADAPQVAVGADGTTTITWTLSFGGTNQIIQAATRAAGASDFGPVKDLSATGRIADDPQIAIAPDGAITVTWERFNGSFDIIQAATQPAGDAEFGAAANLSTTGADANDHQIAIDPAGQTTIAWERLGDNDGVIEVATRAAGASDFGAPVPLTPSETDLYALDPQIAVAPDGATTVTWARDNASYRSVVQARTRAAGATLFGNVQSLSDDSRSAEEPQIAVDPDGATTITWHRSNGTNDIIQAATRPAGSIDFGAPDNISASGKNAESPQIAAGSDGAITITWSRKNDNNQYAVQAATSAPARVSLAVTTAGTGTGSVTSSPAGISCGATCEAVFPTGSTVSLTAAPSAGSAFSGWGGACSGSSTTCTVTMSAAASVTATFAPASAPTPGPAPGPTPASDLGVGIPPAIARAGLPVAANGTVRLPLVCPPGIAGGCDASGVLSTRLRGARQAEGRRSEQASRTRVLARFRGVEIASGKRRLYSVRLDRATYVALRRAGIRRVPATLRIVNRLETGASAVTNQRVWLRILPLVVPVTG